MQRHGINVGVERVGDEVFLTFKAVGTLTHEDYEFITPVIDEALEGIKEKSVKVFFDVEEMDGWELRAAWDDFKIGIKHAKKFSKIALYGHKKWQEVVSKVGSWFTSGEVQYFKDYDAALKWLQES